TFTSMFDLKACHGTSSLSGLNSVLVSRHLADKILGGDAVGKAIRLKDGDELMVSGVYENFPANSSFAGVDVIASLAYHFLKRLMHLMTGKPGCSSVICSSIIQPHC